TYRPSEVKDWEDRLEVWRGLTAEITAEKERELARTAEEMSGWGRRVGGGAPSIVQCLARLDQAAPVNNTFTAAQSIIGTTGAAGPVGPFSVDYFKTIGACWTQEASGIIGTTG